MKTICQNKVFSGERPDGRNVACFCGLTKLNDGSLFVTGRLGSTKDCLDEDIAYWRSTDNGQSWSLQGFPFESYLDDKSSLRCGYISELPRGELLFHLGWTDRSNGSLYNDKTMGLCEMYPLISKSSDQGANWSKPEKVDTFPIDLPSAATGPILCIDNSTIASQFEVQKRWDDTYPIFNYSSLKFSYDQGKTWPEYTLVAGRPEMPVVHWDQRISHIKEDKWAVFFWSFDTANNCDVNIHWSFSNNNCRSWSKPKDTGIKGQIASMAAVSEDYFVLFYIRRDEIQQIRAIESFDGGKSWNTENPLVIYENQKVSHDENLANAMSEWMFGHPYPVVLSEKEIALVHYSPAGKGSGINFYRIEL